MEDGWTLSYSENHRYEPFIECMLHGKCSPLCFCLHYFTLAATLRDGWSHLHSVHEASRGRLTCSRLWMDGSSHSTSLVHPGEHRDSLRGCTAVYSSLSFFETFLYQFLIQGLTMSLRLASNSWIQAMLPASGSWVAGQWHVPLQPALPFLGCHISFLFHHLQLLFLSVSATIVAASTRLHFYVFRLCWIGALVRYYVFPGTVNVCCLWQLFYFLFRCHFPLTFLLLVYISILQFEIISFLICKNSV